MGGKAKILFRLSFLLIILFAGISLLLNIRKGVEANLLSLLGKDKFENLQKASSVIATSAKFLVKADSEEAAKDRLKELGVDLPSSAMEQNYLKILAPYAHVFLSASTRDLLERGEFAQVRDASASRLFSPTPPVISPNKDPFLLFTDYVLESSQPRGNWVLISVDMKPEQALVALNAVRKADDIRCAGAPFHTAVAYDNSRKEINVLSVLSVLCVMLFGWKLTNSLKFIPVLICSLGTALCVSSSALFVLFDNPHVITFVFGTSLIGISVDYVYHILSARYSIARPLTISYLSTMACFLPLLFSEVEVLKQIAVFTISGLTTVFLGVIAFSSWIKTQFKNGAYEKTSSKHLNLQSVFPRLVQIGKNRRVLNYVRFSILIFVLTLLIFKVFNYNQSSSDRIDIARLYMMDPYLKEGECLLREISGGRDFIPSASEQKHNAKLVKRLYELEGTNYCKMTGLPVSVLKLPDDECVFAPKELLESALSQWNSKIRTLLSMAILLIAVGFVIVLGRASFDFIVPMHCTYLLLDGFIFLIGEHNNFFASVCFFVFLGLGFDYSAFRSKTFRSQSDAENVHCTPRAIFYSFLTSFVSFGLLAFTDFAVTRIMGITLAAGMMVSYVLAKLFCGNLDFLLNHKDPHEEHTVWYNQREQCASLFWARFMWYSYNYLGKNFQKIVFLLGMPVIYVLSRSARISLRKFYQVLSEFTGKEASANMPRLFMHILRFSWGVMDKTDSCTLRKNPPKMLVRDDEGWRIFRQTVNSGKGAFILCTHVGMIGVLPSLPDALAANGKNGMRIPKVNAFQQMQHNAVFMKVFMEHFDDTRLQLHAVEDISVDTAVKMKDAIDRGELVIMAGDRVSAGSKSVFKHKFMGRDCVWPKGVYRFAKLMESPVFAVTCVSTGWNRYEVHFVSLNTEPTAMLDGFVAFLEKETIAYPGQWYQFYDFFHTDASDKEERPQ